MIMADEKNDTSTTPTPTARSAADRSVKAEPKSSASSATGADLDRARSSGLRTGGTSEAAAEEYARLGVNPALDNRTGDQRPQRRGLEPKPQQFDGPEVGHFEEHAEEHGGEFRELFGGGDVDPVGMRSEGPHGRGDES
jgi:hypothetical protein